MSTLALSNGPSGTKEIFEYLCECAKNMYTDNYQHICEEVEKRSQGTIKVIPADIGRYLGCIRDECIKIGMPWINALAVGLNNKDPDPKNHWRPSDGFLPQRGKWNPSHELLWRGIVLQVFSYDWNGVTVA